MKPMGTKTASVPAFREAVSFWWAAPQNTQVPRAGPFGLSASFCLDSLWRHATRVSPNSSNLLFKGADSSLSIELPNESPLLFLEKLPPVIAPLFSSSSPSRVTERFLPICCLAAVNFSKTRVSQSALAFPRPTALERFPGTPPSFLEERRTPQLMFYYLFFVLFNVYYQVCPTYPSSR